MSIQELSITNFILSNGIFIKPEIMKGNPGILLVHANWCHHCQIFMPIYKDIAMRLNNARDSFICLSIESEELKKDDGSISKTLGIQGFPCIYWVDQNGKVLGQYKGNRDQSSILAEACTIYHHCILEH